jgi:glycosyltransferase involved in cell wall biosynthesis
MVRRNLFNSDASDRASSELEYVLRKEASRGEEVKRVSVEEALKAAPVYQSGETRNVTRVLFISQDSALLNPTTQSLDGFLDISTLFDEVHIVILREGIPAKNPVLRVGANIWLYTASSRSWLLTAHAGIKVIEEQLVFAAGFRPDLIVARDPFESAIVADKIARRFARPAQLHILEDYTVAEFLKKSPHNFWRRFIPRFVIPRFSSVRTANSTIEKIIAKKFTVPDLAVLPRFQNYNAIIAAKATVDLKEIYKPFIFFIVFIGKLGHESTLYRAIDAARFVLRNPRVGLLVVGDGPAKSEFQRRTKILEIEKQVVFETRDIDTIAYLKSANLVVVTDTDADSEEVVLQAAAAGTPLIMARTEKREDLFEHGVSGYLCEQSDVQAFADRISDILNSVGLRKVFSERAQAMVQETFHQNIREYKEAYRASIEQAMFVESDEEEIKETAV